jgi:hypothetical protein
MKLVRSQDKEHVERKGMSPVHLHGVVLGCGKHIPPYLLYTVGSMWQGIKPTQLP